MSGIRRVVTGLDGEGRSCFLFDGEADGILWRTDRSPADNSSQNDAGGGGFSFDIPTGGSVLLQVEFPPKSTHPLGMHATDSIDYGIIISGEIILTTETGETTLRAGDVIIDRGISHAWRNDSDTPCRVIYCFLPAAPVGSGATISGEVG